MPAKRLLTTRLIGCLFASLSLLAPAITWAEGPILAVEPSDHGMVVTVDGQLFAEYRTNSGSRPVVWPLIGPTDEAMTRSWPVGERLENEEVDHPHHRGMWVGYDQVAGYDFWHDLSYNPRCGRQVHRGFESAGAEGDRATIVTRNDWLSPSGEVVARDKRTLVFGAGEEVRWVDFTIELTGAGGPLELGDSKEGFFALRVPGAMKVDAQLGGRIITSAGRADAEAWGMPAAWVDYHGPATKAAAGEAGETVGVAILSHPSNFCPIPRWHVRPYGLYAANPLGEEVFPEADGPKQGSLTIAEGESIKLRYRVVLHRGDEVEGRVAERFAQYAGE